MREICCAILALVFFLLTKSVYKHDWLDEDEDYTALNETFEENQTKCDDCPRLGKCIEEGRLIECTCYWNIFKHYVIGRGESCPGIESED